MIWYCLIIIVLFWGYICNKPKVYYWLGLLLMFIITAFRDPALGGDIILYRSFFDSVPTIFGKIKEIDTSYTIGYVWLNMLVKTFVSDYRAYQVVYTLLTMFLLHVVLFKLRVSDKDKCLILLSYFCFKFLWFFWNTLRQNIADLLFWLFLIAYYKNEIRSKVKKLLFVCTGLALPALFHSSAWLNFLFFPVMLYIGRWKGKKRMFLVIAISLTLFVISSTIFASLLDAIIMYVDSRYTMYEEAEAGNANIINYALKMLFFILFTLHYDKEDYPYKKMILDGLTMVILIGSVNQELLARVYEYYAISLYVSFGFVTHYFQSFDKRLVAFVFTLAMVVIFMRFVMITDEGMYMDFRFW